MLASKWFLVVSTVFAATAAGAATIDMSDPRRTVALEDGIRIDAQIGSEFVSPRARIHVTYQIQNLSSEPVAIAEKACDASYDSDSRTITISLGMEVPASAPALVVISPGQKRVFTGSAPLRANIPELGPSFSNRPRIAQIKVNILRDLRPFSDLLKRPRPLTDEEFDRWLESNESIFLNPIPVRYRPAETGRIGDASQR